jgi:hypothetical protein
MQNSNNTCVSAMNTRLGHRTSLKNADTDFNSKVWLQDNSPAQNMKTDWPSGRVYPAFSHTGLYPECQICYF